MAEGDGFIIDEFKSRTLTGQMPLETDVLKVALMTSSWVPAVATDTTFAAISAFECSGTGYTAGGETLTGAAVTKDGANNRALFDGNDVTWTSLGALSPQPAWAVIYNATTGYLIAYWEITTLTNGGDYSLQFATAPDAILILT